MPIRTGSRLDQLLALRERLNHEIEVEKRAVERATPGRPDVATALPGRPIGKILSREDVYMVRARLGVTAAQIRTWAREHGYDVSVRGAIPAEMVDAFAHAHEAVTE